ncbi:hypothetical protein AXF42_Ash009369 [Apostasia shenzhenica]|uniref:Endoplasmic reticulum transmembrane protein n=1 Tax=Apostasia shenzhenica TaxID=1088818 RepID=A0A2I0B3V5_9ASPA|nr:hypothetical protein AXF42_Ash009369 [Apostasia shenzhenica]
MIQLLFTLLLAEVAVVVVLLFKTPLRKLAIMGLDRLKRGRGPIVVRTVAGTVLVVVSSSVYSMVKIKSHSTEIGGLSPTDQVLMSRHLLEASLMGIDPVLKLFSAGLGSNYGLISCEQAIGIGYSLLLALIVDRLHHYIRELRGLRRNMEAVTKQNRALEEAKLGSPDEIKSKEKEIVKLKEQIDQLKSEHEAKSKELQAAEASTTALRKQSEGFLIEYDRLLEDNQNLRNQLQSLDRMLSHTDGKKNS